MSSSRRREDNAPSEHNASLWKSEGSLDYQPAATHTASYVSPFFSSHLSILAPSTHTHPPDCRPHHPQPPSLLSHSFALTLSLVPSAKIPFRRSFLGLVVTIFQVHVHKSASLADLRVFAKLGRSTLLMSQKLSFRRSRRIFASQSQDISDGVFLFYMNSHLRKGTYVSRLL